MMKWVLAGALLAGGGAEDEGVRRVEAHLLIEDPNSALGEAEALVSQFPTSKVAGSLLIRAYAARGNEELALAEWHKLSLSHPNLIEDRSLLEDISWGVLKKGLDSSQNAVRLASMIGSYLTQDVRTVAILKKMMRDSNAIIRSVAVQMASGYQDAPLKDEIARLMAEEKVWVVRLEVIKAIGQLRLKELSSELKSLIQSDKATYEERQYAIEAAVHISEKIEIEELSQLAESDRAGIRHLACMIASHFEIEEAKDQILKLIGDSHPDVRIAAIDALGIFYRKKTSLEEARKALSEALVDANPAVAISAAWAALLIDPPLGEAHLQPWLTDSLPENRRLAAAALAAAGSKGISLSLEVLKESRDPYVLANVAMGLLGQRVEVERCSNALYDFLMAEKRLWMWDTRPNPLFQVLAPSQVRHVDHIPNYPEAIDQMTRLNLVSLLAVVEDPRAQTALKSFLQKRTWGITGVAAATLLQEGDESALEVVRKLVSDSDPNVKLQACLVLAMLGKEESVIQDLQAAYETSDHERKLHILEALGKVGNISSFKFLLGTLKEPFPILRVAAAAALIQSMNR
jgi:HEAT repeat protein